MNYKVFSVGFRTTTVVMQQINKAAYRVKRTTKTVISTPDVIISFCAGVKSAIDCRKSKYFSIK